MLKLLLVTFVIFSSLGLRAYECANSEVRITIEGTTVLESVEDFSDNPKKVFDNDYVYTIYEAGEEAKSFSLIAATTDGAGQDAFDVFRLDSDLSPVEEVADVYYEHEGGCLEGGYYSFKKREWVSIESCWGESKDRLICNEY